MQPVQFWGAAVKLAFRFSGLVGWLNEGVVTFEEIGGNPDGVDEMFVEIVGKPDGLEEIWWVEVVKPLVLLSDATGMVNMWEVLIDKDGNPDDLDSADVTLVLALGNPDGVELWKPDRSETLGSVKEGTVGVEPLLDILGSPEGDDVTDPEDVPIAVLFDDIVGIRDGVDPPDEVLFDEIVASPDGLEENVPAEELLLVDIVGTPDGAALVGNPMDERFDGAVGNPEEAVELWYPDRSETLGKLKGGIVPEELLAGMVGTPDGTEMVGNTVNEMLEKVVGDPEAAVATVDSADGAGLLASPLDEVFKERVGNPNEAVELWSPDRSDAFGRVKGGSIGEELLAEIVGIPDRVEEVPLRQRSAWGCKMEQRLLT